MIIIGAGSVESTKPIPGPKEKNNRHGDSLKEREPESARQCREFRPSCANREAPETGTDTGGEEKKKTILTEPLFELLLLLLVLAP